MGAPHRYTRIMMDVRKPYTQEKLKHVNSAQSINVTLTLGLGHLSAAPEYVELCVNGTLKKKL